MGFLSSQPKRQWGSDDENEPTAFELTADDWPPTPPKPKPQPVVVAAAKIPPSLSSSIKGKAPAVPLQKSSSTRDAFVGSVSSRSVSTLGAGSGSSSSRGTAVAPSGSRTMGGSSSSSSKPLASKPLAPLTSKSSFNAPKPTSSSSRPPTQLAPLFRTKSSGPPSASSSASAFKWSAGAAAAGSSSASNGLPKKRTMPWENLLDSPDTKPRAGSSSSSSNFRTVGGGSESGTIKGRMLTSETMDIKQKVILSPEQQMVLKLVVDDGKSVFFTGSAGTGKSVLLREIIASLKRKYKGAADAVAVTASTGMAACNIGGTTIHSFAGIGLGNDAVELLIGKVKKNRVASGKWQRVKVLVIDEVSMVDGILFDKLAAIGSALKKKVGSNRPFGGIQLVVTGDFFQLPPVSKGMATFAFEAKSWRDSIQHTVNLTQVFRQKDTRFIDMLNEMRFGTLSKESIETFRTLHRDPNYTDGIDPTELFPMRNEVDRSNQARLRALAGEEVVFKAEDWPAPSPGSNQSTNTYLSNFMATEKLVLKVGAQVMLIKNLDTTLVNGTIGKVIGFGFPDLEESDEEGGESIKMEGGASEAAQARKKTKLVANAAQGKAEMAPMVEWRTPLGVERKLMVREEFKVEDMKGAKLASRKQYPIILAWAMSIHKSQGQTLPRVKVDLGKVFEKGQSYVALSRATCLEGLQVLRFTPDKVAAHPKVVQWSKSLQVLS